MARSDQRCRSEPPRPVGDGRRRPRHDGTEPTLRPRSRRTTPPARTRPIGMTIPTVTGTDFDGNDITIARRRQGQDPRRSWPTGARTASARCRCSRSTSTTTPMPDDVELITVSTSVKPGAENYPPQEWLDGEGWTAPVLADDENSSVAAGLRPQRVPVLRGGRRRRQGRGPRQRRAVDRAVRRAVEAARPARLAARVGQGWYTRASQVLVSGTVLSTWLAASSHQSAWSVSMSRGAGDHQAAAE